MSFFKTFSVYSKNIILVFSALEHTQEPHSFLHLQSIPCYECVNTHLTVSLWKDIGNSFQFFTVTNSATISTYVFPENMFLDIELLVKSIGHSKILTDSAKLLGKKNCSATKQAKACYHSPLPTLNIISLEICQFEVCVCALLVPLDFNLHFPDY